MIKNVFFLQLVAVELSFEPQCASTSVMRFRRNLGPDKFKMFPPIKILWWLCNFRVEGENFLNNGVKILWETMNLIGELHLNRCVSHSGY